MDATEYRRHFNHDGNYMDTIKGSWDNADYSKAQRSTCTDEAKSEAFSFFGTHSETFLSPKQIDAAAQICAPTALSCIGTTNRGIASIHVVNRTVVGARFQGASVFEDHPATTVDRGDDLNAGWRKQGPLSAGQSQVYQFARAKVGRAGYAAVTATMRFAVGDRASPTILACAVEFPETVPAVRTAATITEAEFALTGESLSKEVTQDVEVTRDIKIWSKGVDVCVAPDEVLNPERVQSIAPNGVVEKIEDLFPCDYKRFDIVDFPKDRPNCATVKVTLNHCVETQYSIPFYLERSSYRVHGLGWERRGDIAKRTEAGGQRLPYQTSLIETEKYRDVRGVSPVYRVTIVHPSPDGKITSTTLSSEKGQDVRNGFQALVQNAGGRWTLHISQVAGR